MTLGERSVKVTADQLLQMLAERHAGDVFVPECNMGSVQMDRCCRRMDAWAMLRTWSPPTCIGYEIKVTRYDFLQDQKWREYLPATNLFYFVTPKGLIQRDELDLGVGLICPAGSKLRIVKQAARREVEPTKLLRLHQYVLMSRTKIVGGMREANAKDRAAYWRQWLLDDLGEHYLGHMVSRRIRERVETAEKRTREVEAKLERWQAVVDQLRAWGVDTEQRWPTEVQQLKDLVGGDDERREVLAKSVKRMAERIIDEANRALR